MRRAWAIPLSAAGLVLFCLASSAWAGEAEPESPGPYVVRKGDTLWGIARERLQDPFRWPRIWERNPFIADPNLIYPGDMLAVPGAEPQAPGPIPATAEAADKATASAGAVSPAAPPTSLPAEAPAPAAPAIVPAQAKEAPAPPPTDDATQKLGHAEARAPVASASALACSPILVTENQLGVGRVVRSYEDRQLLSMTDRVFLGLAPGRTVRVGDRLAAIRPGRLIAHPGTGRLLGRVVDTRGILQVLEVRDGVALAVIQEVCDEIEIGNAIIPFSPAELPDTVPVPAARSLEGMIVGALRAEQMLALQQTIFLDLGAAAGVAVGDVFAIYRPSLPVVMPAAVYPIPPERLGEAVVVRVTDQTATAVIAASPKESHVGDRAVLSLQAKP